MGSLGSASIELTLDRSQFDSDIKKLQATDAGQIAYRIKLNSKDFEQQIKALRIQPTIFIPVEANTATFERQVKLLRSAYGGSASLSQQPIFIPLEINTAAFDQQIKKLSTSIDPIKVDLAPNVKDFQEKLRRLSNISPIAVDIKVDEAKVRQQFETVGKYAAEGFAQGFSGVEGAGKSAVDSLIGSVNKQLGIQSPSKVFRDIGKYAIAGLMQGLESTDTHAVINKITSEFKAIDISAKVRLVADTGDLQGQIKGRLVATVAVEVGGNSTKKLSDSIADSVAHAVKKTQSKGLFGGLLSMAMLPLKVASAGLFLGAGLPLGESLGAGIAKGVNKALKGKFNANLSQIGINLTDLSKADWNLAKAIDALFIEGNPIGKARNAVKELQDVFADLKVLMAPGAIEKVVDFGKLSSAGPREFKKQYVAAAKKAKSEGRELTPEQFTEELKPKAELRAIGTAVKLAAVPFGFKNKVMSFEAQRQIEARSRKITVPEISEPTVTLVTGGFQKQRGRGAFEIAELAKAVLPNSRVIPIPNTYTDRKATDTHSELVNFIKSLGGDVPPGLLDTIQNTEKLLGTAAHGYSPDAIRIAAHARAVQRKYPDKPVNALTFSGGTYPLEQAIQFDTDAGGKAKGIGLGAGLYGLTGRHNPNYRAMIGEQDPLGFPFQLLPPTKNTTIIPNFADTTSMDVHNPKRYFASPPVQQAMSEMFEGFVPPQGTVKAQQDIFALTNRKVATDKHLNRLNKFNADPASVPSEKVDKSFGELADFLSKNAAAFSNPVEPLKTINKDPKQRTIPELVASGDNLAVESQHYYSHAKNTLSKTSAILAKPLGIPEAQLESYEPEQRVKVIRAVSKVKSEAPNLNRTIDRLQGATDDGQFSFYTKDSTLALKRAQDLKGLTSYLRSQVFTDLPADIDKLAQEYLKYLEELQAAIVKLVTNGEAIAPEILAQKDKLNLLSFDGNKAVVEGHSATTLPVAPSRTLESGMVVNATALPLVQPVSTPIPSIKEIHPLAREFVDVPKTELPTPNNKSELEFNSPLDVHKFASTNLNAKGAQDLARRMGIDTKNTNKEHLLNEITSLGGTAETRGQIAQLVSQLTPDKFLSSSGAKPKSNTPTDALKTIGELKKARKDLADALKSALELSGEARRIVLEQITKDAHEQEAIAKQLSSEYQLTPAHSKSLGGIRSQFKSISEQSKESLESIQHLRDPVSTQKLHPLPVAQQKPQGIFDIGLSKVDRNTERKIKSGQQELKLATENFQKIFTEVIKSSGLKPKEVEGQIPTVSFLHAITKGAGQYSGKGNRVALSMDARKKLATGRISKDDLDTLIHEIRHAIQLDFGRAKEADVERGLVGIPLLSTKKKDDRNSALASTREYRNQFKRNRGIEPTREILQAVMALEEDAVAFAAEVTPQIHKNLKNILKPIVGSKPTPFAPPKASGQISKLLRNAIPPAPWEIDPSLDFRNLSPRTTLFSTPKPALPPPPPGFNLPITRTTLPPPPPGFYSPIAKPKSAPPTSPPLPSSGTEKASTSKVKDPNQGIGAFFSGLKMGKQGRDTGASAIGDIFTNIRSQVEKTAPILTTFGGLLSSLFKGFLAFQGMMILQSVLSKLSTDAFKAYVELDRLKTSLNFASGGAAGGAQNLAFVRKTVDDLKIPLKSSTEGFVGLAAAARGTSLEGKGTRELFLGMADASTVLSLSNEQTSRAFLALQEALSKGKLSSEEMRQQLAESGLTGALGIAARAMGVTEQEFSRLLDTGQIISENFLPKFSAQLKSEFGDAAKDASGNAQSAIFGVENAFLSLQQGVGEGIAPAAMVGLNGLAIALKEVSKFGKEIAIIISAVSTALVFKLGSALSEILGKIILNRMAGATLGANFAQLGSIINNSFSAKLAGGMFAVLEVVNLLNSAINTDLVQSSQKAAESAKRAAEETKKAFEKPKPEASGGVERFVDKYAIAPINSATGSKIRTFAEKENAEVERGKTQGLDPIATSGVGRFVDDWVIKAYNMLPASGSPNSKTNVRAVTWGEYERNTFTNSIDQQGLSNTESLAEARHQLAEFKTGTGEGGKLRGLDAQLKTAEEQRAILQAQIKRDYVDKGQTVPAESKRQLDSQNLKVTALNDQRSEAAKPLSLEENRTTQKINYFKSQLNDLNDPDKIANQGGEAAADIQREKIKARLEPLKQFLAELQAARGALRIDPILSFTQALRQLNLAFAEGQEKSQLAFEASKAAISVQQVTGFQSNKFSGKTAAVNLALREKEKAGRDYQDQKTISKGLDVEVNRPEFQTTLQRLGVSPDASAAKIDDVLKNTTDEADKGILEKLKASREQKNKLSTSRGAYADSMGKVQSTVQDFHSFKIDEKTADSSAVISKNENLSTASWKRSLEAKVVVEEVANEQIAKIQLKTTQDQRKNLDDQLSAVRADHEAGYISAEAFAKQERDLTTQQTALEKQEAENRLAVQQTGLARRLKELEFFNKKAEALTGTKQADSTRVAKEKLFSSGLTPQAQDQFALSQTKIDAIAASDKVTQVKDRIAQNKQLYKEGKKDARDFMADQYALNLELAQSNVAVIDQKIAGEERYREVVERNISVKQTIVSTGVKQQTLTSGLTPEAQDKAALEQNKIDKQAVIDRINFIKSRVGVEKDATQAIATLNSQLVDLKIQGEEKYRENFEHSIQRVVQAEENRFKKQQSQLDESKAKLDLYNQSLERTTKLEQSRNNLSKALSDSRIAVNENQTADANDDLSLAEKLKDKNTKGRTKRAIIKQLTDRGYERGSPEKYELQIEERKAAAERVIALAKQEAMAREQEFQKKTLENDLKRQQIAAQIALYEAQGYQLASQKSKLEADAALKIAIAKKDPLAIETAKVGVELANKEIVLGDRRVESAQANVNDQPEIAANSTQEQKVTQNTENQNFQSEEKRRERKTALTLVEAGEKAHRPMDLTTAENKAGTINPTLAFPTKIESNPMPSLNLKPGENLFEGYQRQREGMKLPSASAKFPTSITDIPPMDKTTTSVSSASIQPRESAGGNQFVEALKMANQGIEQRLDALRGAIMTLANTPRSLTVSTANPVDDAADFMNRMSRGQVMAGGM